MPVYEIVRERPPGRSRVSFADRETAEVGDVVTINGSSWVVVLKEPPFEERRIERIVCTPLP
jgi:hypothetical protein